MTKSISLFAVMLAGAAVLSACGAAPESDESQNPESAAAEDTASTSESLYTWCPPRTRGNYNLHVYKEGGCVKITNNGCNTTPDFHLRINASCPMTGGGSFPVMTGMAKNEVRTITCEIPTVDWIVMADPWNEVTETDESALDNAVLGVSAACNPMP